MSDVSQELATYEPPKGAGKGIMALKELDFKQMMFVGSLMHSAGMFDDLKSAAQAQVKIMFGQELGLAPGQSMNGFHVIKGKVQMAANLIASKILESGRYRYRVITITDDACVVRFQQLEGVKWVDLGDSKFTKEDATAAGTQNMGKFPRNMLFARAISNGYKWYCPDIFSVNVYVEGEVIENDPPVAKTEAEEQADLDAAAARLNRRKTAAKAGQKGLKVAESTPEPSTPETAPSESTEPAAAEPETQPEPETAPEPENHKSKPEPTIPPKSAETEKPAAQVEGKPETYMEPVAPATPPAEASEFATTPAAPEPEADTSGPHTTDQRDTILKYLDEMGFNLESEKKAIFTGLTTLSTFKDLTKDGADKLIEKLQNTDDPEALRGWFINAQKEPASGA